MKGVFWHLMHHEMLHLRKDPRLVLPFLVSPIFLILLHTLSLTFANPGDPSVDWQITRMFLVVMAVMASSLAVPLCADAFAGERERQTLETLLLLPVPRMHLFWVKVISLLPWPALIGIFAQSSVLILFLWRTGETPPLRESIDALSLTPCFAFALGSFTLALSLRAETVRAAAQGAGLLSLLAFPLVGGAATYGFSFPYLFPMLDSALLAGGGGALLLARRRFQKPIIG